MADRNFHRYNPGSFLSEWFPRQTKSIPRIIIWTIVYIADVVLVFWLASRLGIAILELQYQLRTVAVMLYLVIALVPFCAEAYLSDKIESLFR